MQIEKREMVLQRIKKIFVSIFYFFESSTNFYPVLYTIEFDFLRFIKI